MVEEPATVPVTTTMEEQPTRTTITANINDQTTISFITTKGTTEMILRTTAQGAPPNGECSLIVIHQQSWPNQSDLCGIKFFALLW